MSQPEVPTRPFTILLADVTSSEPPTRTSVRHPASSREAASSLNRSVPHCRKGSLLPMPIATYSPAVSPTRAIAFATATGEAVRLGSAEAKGMPAAAR